MAKTRAWKCWQIDMLSSETMSNKFKSTFLTSRPPPNQKKISGGQLNAALQECFPPKLIQTYLCYSKPLQARQWCPWWSGESSAGSCSWTSSWPNPNVKPKIANFYRIRASILGHGFVQWSSRFQSSRLCSTIAKSWQKAKRKN